MAVQPLATLQAGQVATIINLAAAPSLAEAESWRLRLAEMGIVEGETLIVKYFGPIGKDPIAVSVRGGLVAVGRREAELINVEVCSA